MRSILFQYLQHLHLYGQGRFFQNIIEKLSGPRGKQFALFYIPLRPGHLALLQLYVTLHRDVKMSSSILKSRVVKPTFVVNS